MSVIFDCIRYVWRVPESFLHSFGMATGAPGLCFLCVTEFHLTTYILGHTVGIFTILPCNFFVFLFLNTEILLPATRKFRWQTDEWKFHGIADPSTNRFTSIPTASISLIINFLSSKFKNSTENSPVWEPRLIRTEYTLLYSFRGYWLNHRLVRISQLNLYEI